MKIHSDILSYADIHEAVPNSCYLVEVYNEKGGGYFTIVPELSRKRERGYLVRLSGSSPYNMQGLREKSATWDEWGIFIDKLFQQDPNAIIGIYESREDFITKTTAEYDRCAQHRPDLKREAPWLAHN